MRLLSRDDLSNILTRGGTILGTSNTANPSRFMVGIDESGQPVFEDVTQRVIEHIAERLVAGGMRHDMPAAVISRGGLPGEQHVVAPLRDLARISRNAGLAAPALIVIGEVVTLASCSARRTEQQREIGLEPGTKETRS